MSLIQATRVSKTFGEGEAKVHALNQVDLEIHEGEFAALVGPSGSGKTTLLNIISGLDVPSGGEVSLSGTNLQTMSDSELCDFRRDKIGFVFQSFNLLPVLTAEENVEYIMLLQGIQESERTERARSMMNRMGLSQHYNRFPRQLSGGQQQRVAIARAMVAHPRIILADEPTANLDSHTGNELIDLMKTLNREEGMTFVFSTHDPKIMDQAKRLIHLEDGKIVRDEKK